MFWRERQKIAGELKSAADDKEAAKAMKEEYQTRLTSVNKEAEQILEDARKRAKQRKQKYLQKPGKKRTALLRRVTAK